MLDDQNNGMWQELMGVINVPFEANILIDLIWAENRRMEMYILFLASLRANDPVEISIIRFMRILVTLS